MDGASMAAPHVAALAALYKSSNYNMSVQELENKIKNNPNIQILTLSTCATDFSEARTVVFAVMNLYKTYYKK